MTGSVMYNCIGASAGIAFDSSYGPETLEAQDVGPRLPLCSSRATAQASDEGIAERGAEPGEFGGADVSLPGRGC